MMTVIQHKLPQFQAEGLVQKSGNWAEDIANVNELLSQPKFQEQYGRLLVFDPQKVKDSGFTISSQNLSGADNTVGVETFSFYSSNTTARPSEVASPNASVEIPKQVIAATIIPTEIVNKLLGDIRKKLITNQQFNVIEIEKTAMFYFGLAEERQLEIMHDSNDRTAQIQQQIKLGREVILSEVQGYFEERMHFFGHLLTYDEADPGQSTQRINYLDQVNQQVEEIRTLQEYAHRLNLPSLRGFVDAQVQELVQRYNQMIELHHYYKAHTVIPVGSIQTEVAPDTIRHRRWVQIPQAVGNAIRKVFKF